MDDLARRIEVMRQGAAEKRRKEQEALLERRRKAWSELNATDDGKEIADLLKALKDAGMDPKPIYILIKKAEATTPPGTYRLRLPGNSGIHEVTIDPGWQRIW